MALVKRFYSLEPKLQPVFDDLVLPVSQLMAGATLSLFILDVQLHPRFQLILWGPPAEGLLEVTAVVVSK